MCLQKQVRRRRPEIEALMKNRLEDGVYMVFVACTEDKILVDERENMPAVKLQMSGEEAAKLTEEHPDFAWLLELGSSWGSVLKTDTAGFLFVLS